MGKPKNERRDLAPDQGARAVAAHVMQAISYRPGWVPSWSWAGDACAFNRLDADASGYLTIEELAPAIERLPMAARHGLDEEARALGRGLFRPWPLQVVLVLALPALVFEGVMGFAVIGWQGVLPYVVAATGAAIAAALLLHAEGRRRRSRLVARLAADGRGATGAALAAAIVMLLDGPAWRVPPLLAGPRPAGDGELDAAEWGAEGLPKTPKALATALGRLPSAVSVTAAIDAALAWNRRLVVLDGASILAGIGAFAAGFTAREVASGFTSRTGHAFAPDPQAAAAFWQVAIALTLLALAAALCTRLLALRVRRRLGAAVQVQLESGGAP